MREGMGKAATSLPGWERTEEEQGAAGMRQDGEEGRIGEYTHGFWDDALTDADLAAAHEISLHARRGREPRLSLFLSVFI